LFIQSNHHQTLMNQMVSSVVKSTIFLVIFCHTPMTLRYLVEQASEIFCQYLFFFQRCMVLQILLMGVAFMLVRYICVFHSKNISCIQNDFWICFLNLWTLGFSAIAYFVVCQITINRPMDFYFCLGKIQKKSQRDGPFVDYLWASISILALIVLLSIGVKFIICKYQKKNTEKAVAQQGHYFTEIRRMNMSTFSLCIIGLIEICITLFIPIYQMEYGDLDSLTTYPGYLWVYMFHLYAGNILTFQYLPFYYGRNEYLYNFAKRVLKEKFNNLFQK
jgi:hypothetical protein